MSKDEIRLAENTMPLLCAECDTVFSVPLGMAGQPMPCPGCQGEILVPLEAPPAIKESHLECAACGTWLSAPLTQVGQEIECHDCGTLCRVPPPAAAKPRKVMPDIGPALSLETAESTPEVDYLTERPREGRPDARLANRQRRDEQTATANSQLGSFFRKIALDWAVLSLLLAATQLMGVFTISLRLAHIGMAFVSLTMAIFTGAAATVLLSLSSQTFLAVMVNAAEGAPLEVDRPAWYDWTGWVLAGRQLLWAALVAGSPGGILAKLLSLAELPYVWCLPLSLWLFYPIVLCSVLHGDSLADIVNREVLVSFRRQPLKWLRFYGESLVLVAILWLVMGVTSMVPFWYLEILLTAPVWVAAAILYFRRLGSLAGGLNIEVETA